MSRAQFDVVIVGAGSAGCVLAARLTENTDRTVLLLEAGPVFADVAAHPASLLDERTFPQDHLWRYDGVHGPGERAVSVVRGRVLGGSGAVNGLIYQRGLPEDYDGWGMPAWRHDALLPFFERIERDPTRLGSAGQTPIERLGPDAWAPSHRAFHDALRDLGQPANPDLLLAEHQGVGSYARNSAHGTRMSAALTYLLPALARPGLTVRGGAAVRRVILERGRATGVEVLAGGQLERITAGEVILAAGALETPQLLTHSGLADAATLHALGIAPVADLPGVGLGLSDHPSVVTTARLHAAITDWDLRCLVGLVHSSTAAVAAGRRSDLQLLVMSGPYAGNNGGHLPAAANPATVDVVLNPILYAPDSTGRVEITGRSPERRPRIHYGYLQSAHDRQRLREAVRLTARVFAHPAFTALIADPAGVPDARTLDADDALDAWIRTGLQTTHHSCGTCRMGPGDDPLAVVDEQCRVRGVRGLRVADLSVVPRAPSAPTNATAMVVSERVAAWL